MTNRLLISQRETCALLGISRPTLIAEIKAGRLAKMRTDALPGDLDDRPDRPLPVPRAVGEPMSTEEVEIYSYAPNQVVLRLPWRRYPGILIQGDDLSGFKGMAERACVGLLARSASEERNEARTGR
jgi:hypothetical protein